MKITFSSYCIDGYTGLPCLSLWDSLPFACDTGQPVRLRSSLFCLLSECVILAVQEQRLYGSPPGYEYLNPLVPTVSHMIHGKFEVL